MATKQKQQSVTVGSRTKQFEEAAITIEGTAPLLVARPMPWDIGGKFWEQFDREIREAQNPAEVLAPHDRELLGQLGFVVNGKIHAEAEAHLRGHWLPDLRPAFPASGFMGACRTAVVQYKGKSKEALTAKKIGGAMQILGDEADLSLVAITPHPSVEAHQAPQTIDVQIGINSGQRRSPRIITRLKFPVKWQATLRVRWLSQLLSDQDVAQVIAWAGNWGIGQWRPSSPHPGMHGTWRIVGTEV